MFIAAMPSKNVLIEISPIESIALSAFGKRDKYLRKSAEPQECTVDDDTYILNVIEMIPKSLLVPQSEHWQKKDTSKIKDFVTKEAVSDWTFSTPYKGTFTFISQQSERIKNFTDLQLEAQSEEGRLRVEVTSEGIPYEKLGPENKILHYGSLYLFETDLEDCGYTMA